MTLGSATWPLLSPRARLTSLLFATSLRGSQNSTTSFCSEVIMKKFFIRAVVAFAVVFAVTVPALADTIRLKDGSVIRGQIISFKNEQFTILVGGGSRGRKSQITVYMEDVDSIDFDSNGGGSGQDNSSSTVYQQPSQPPYQPPAQQSGNNSSNSGPVLNQPTNSSNQGTST